MGKKEIIKEFESASEEVLKEVYTFYRSMKSRRIRKSKDMIETYSASEKNLGKDWNKPEEDIAWQNL